MNHGGRTCRSPEWGCSEGNTSCNIMPLISPPEWYSLWGTMTSDKSRGHLWMNYCLPARGLIHLSHPTCKLKLGNVRFQAETLNNCPFLTTEIDSPWFLVSDRSLGFRVNGKTTSILVTEPRIQGRLPFLGVLVTDIRYLTDCTRLWK